MLKSHWLYTAIYSDLWQISEMLGSGMSTLQGRQEQEIDSTGGLG